MGNMQFSVMKAKFSDILICSVLFLFSFFITLYYPNVFLGIIILLSFGFIVHTNFIKPQTHSITEHIIASIGIGLLTVSLLMASLLYLNKIQMFKEILLLLFLLFLTISFIRRKTSDFKGYNFNREDIIPWVIVILFFFVSVVLRHADFRFPDEYMYLNKLGGITSGGYISDYAQSRYFFFYSYSAIIGFAAPTFRSAEIISLFFMALSLIPTYLLGKELFGKDTGYISALFLAFNPSFIFYSIRLLSDIPLIFLITSFLYFFYKWYAGKNKIDFFISFIFLMIAALVKLHGVIFLGIGALYMLLTLNSKNFKKNIIFLFLLIGTLHLFLTIWDYGGLYLMLKWFFSNITDLRTDIIWVGYKMYITFLSPDLYSMPFVVLFFLGIAVTLKEPFYKKLFLLMPVGVYILFISLASRDFGMGVRNFFEVVPLMSIVAAYGTVHREQPYRSIFWILLCLYLAVLAVMVVYAPRFPHLNFIMPDIPLWIRALTFGAAFMVTFLMVYNRGEGKWHRVTYLVISLVVVSSLLNANFFINMQDGYPDRSKSGIIEAGEWLSENTPSNARIQSNTWELSFWLDTNIKSKPGMRYPESTFLSYYVNRTTYAPPSNEELLFERVKDKEVDYIVLFTDPLLTINPDAETYAYLQKYINQTPNGTELIHTGQSGNQRLLFEVYKVV
ncbi:Dolichyl-phosphate-mannose-protein mannosyltransferase [uncultured archaeon]|nr:Dolichyl-phosphate-mannose-protein mannosyltransferase [uncultured archaeon]